MHGETHTCSAKLYHDPVKRGAIKRVGGHLVQAMRCGVLDRLVRRAVHRR